MTPTAQPGPRIIFFEDEREWRTFCKEKNAWPWYAKLLPIFRPGAFTHTDGDGEPDVDDVIWVAPKEWKAALAGDRMAIDLIHHEWLHNLVPAYVLVQEGLLTQAEYDSLVEKCTHPTEPLDAIRHAMRTGYHTNAFTRFLRRNRTAVRYNDFQRWWGEAPDRAVKHGA